MFAAYQAHDRAAKPHIAVRSTISHVEAISRIANAIYNKSCCISQQLSI